MTKGLCQATKTLGSGMGSLFLGVVGYLSFFFQAEDGIRDLTVTGVQTCALPISNDYTYVLSGNQYETSNLRMSGSQKMLITGTNVVLYVDSDFSMTGSSEISIAPGEIGRASCRERV